MRVLLAAALACVLLAGCKKEPAVAPAAPAAKPAPLDLPEDPEAEADSETPEDFKPTRDEAIADAREQAHLLAFTGFAKRDRIIESATDVLLEALPEEEAELVAKKIAADALAEHRRAQSSWPVPTDCDRLDTAFAALEAEGIVARQNFEDCQTCAMGAISDELEAARQAGKKPIGYAYFHEQDTEGAVDGDGLMLGYGSVSEGDAAAKKVGDRVVKALGVAGLKTEWDGDVGKRIFVAMEWRKRR